MKNCPFHKIKDKISLNNGKNKNEQPYGNIQKQLSEQKNKVKNILEYLNKKDLEKTSKNLNITLDDFLTFKESVKHLEHEELFKVCEKYVSKNLSDLQKLKKELNNLFIKMFWEYFKEKIEELGEHDFLGFKYGKLINIPKERYIGNIGKIKYLLYKNNLIKSNFLNIFFDYNIGLFNFEKIYKYINKKIYNKLNILFLMNRIDLMHYEMNKTIMEIYNIFIEENSKDNDIIKSYLILEHFISKEIKFGSYFETIFPNTNKVNLQYYLQHLYTNNIMLNYKDIEYFLNRQNQQNIKNAIFGGTYQAQAHNNFLYNYGEYNTEKGIVEINLQTLPDECKQKISNDIVEHKLEGKGNGICPFALTKSETQKNKNAFLEEFEFFDSYELKIVKNFSE